ncbi:hypothetical protein KL86SPO_50786 [uncultured Sporomusa sp.]|uniref:Uncharacterized protein n=1 Tax=uncultured Sporomusa sp. TaxID=307249 RepID=A0A212LZK0_9FIRM|nr:hypothetical protein KL86SPO_50786 [uncultured Sporomusa sp.]
MPGKNADVTNAAPATAAAAAMRLNLRRKDFVDLPCGLCFMQIGLLVQMITYSFCQMTGSMLNSF